MFAPLAPAPATKQKFHTRSQWFKSLSLCLFSWVLIFPFLLSGTVKSDHSVFPCWSRVVHAHMHIRSSSRKCICHSKYCVAAVGQVEGRERVWRKGWSCPLRGVVLIANCTAYIAVLKLHEIDELSSAGVCASNTVLTPGFQFGRTWLVNLTYEASHCVRNAFILVWTGDQFSPVMVPTGFWVPLLSSKARLEWQPAGTGALLPCVPRRALSCTDSQLLSAGGHMPSWAAAFPHRSPRRSQVCYPGYCSRARG